MAVFSFLKFLIEARSLNHKLNACQIFQDANTTFVYEIQSGQFQTWSFRTKIKNKKGYHEKNIYDCRIDQVVNMQCLYIRLYIICFCCISIVFSGNLNMGKGLCIVNYHQPYNKVDGLYHWVLSHECNAPIM